MHYLTVQEKQSAFFKSIEKTSESKSFSARLKEIDFSGSIPDLFLDPITSELMNIPMLTSDTRTYDAKTIEDLKKISPFTRKPFTCIENNLLLHAQIEDFVSEEEHKEDETTKYEVRLTDFFSGFFSKSGKVMSNENIKLISEYAITLKKVMHKKWWILNEERSVRP